MLPSQQWEEHRSISQVLIRKTGRSNQATTARVVNGVDFFRELVTQMVEELRRQM